MEGGIREVFYDTLYATFSEPSVRDFTPLT